jgi:lysozyme
MSGTTQPNSLAAGGNPLGVDVSHYNGAISWKTVAAAGIAFAYAKATESVGVSDKRFAANWKGMKAAGLPRGAYHFFHPQNPVDKQAAKFIAAVGSLAPGDLPPMLDLEETSATTDEWDGVPLPHRVPRALQWLQLVERALGRKPIVYTRRGFVQQKLGDASALTPYPLWVAHYTMAPKPALPPGWNAWTIWQYTGSGAVAGITGKVDMNRFQGTQADLLALTCNRGTA